MPDLREPLAATHVHPEAGRGVNTPGLFRPAFNSALFFPSVGSLANREKETAERNRAHVHGPWPRVYRSTERNIAVIRHGTAPRSKKSERKVKKSDREILDLKRGYFLKRSVFLRYFANSFSSVFLSPFPSLPRFWFNIVFCE